MNNPKNTKHKSIFVSPKCFFKKSLKALDSQPANAKINTATKGITNIKL